MKKSVYFLLLFLGIGIIKAQNVQSGLKFKHKIHLENEVECTTCHQAVSTSNSGKDNLIPEMDVCADCHDIESEDNCSSCHVDVDNNPTGVRIEKYNLAFSHQIHLKKIKDCNTCHQPLLDGVRDISLPDMRACISCHKERLVSTDCMTCHQPGENLKPANHSGDFLHTHGQLAKSEGVTGNKSKNCNTCHTVNQCQECHQGENLDRLTHPLNYEFTHSFEARGKEKTCTTCHIDRAFCIDCHKENQVMPQNHRLGWVNNIPGDGGLHKEEASTDLESCMACHETDATIICQPCHGN